MKGFGSTYLSIALSALFISVAAAQTRTYDELESDLRKNIPLQHEFHFALKIKSISNSNYQFWRGTKYLFMKWAGTNCREWLNDPTNFTPCHGDLHFGNIGTYVTQGDFGKVGFGMVDFDDSANLPFQLELLQAMITLDWIAYENNMDLEESVRSKLFAIVCNSYSIAFSSNQNCMEILKDQSLVSKLIEKAVKEKYSSEIKKFTSKNILRKVIHKKNGKVTDILQPIASTQYPLFADAIREAIENDPRLKKLMRDSSTVEILKRIKGISIRHRIDSSGSQGLEKYVILMDTPFNRIDHDIILYLKQQIPSAAERAGIIPAAAKPPGLRMVDFMETLSNPKLLFSSHCMVEGKSFWVTMKEPWSDEIDFSEMNSIKLLEQAADIWGTVAGCSARDKLNKDKIIQIQTAEFQEKVLLQSQDYLNYQKKIYMNFVNDTRVKQQISLANQIESDAVAADEKP